MNHARTLISGVIILAVLIPVFANEALTGRQIAEKVRDANDAASAETTAVLKLYNNADAAQPSESRRIMMRTKRTGTNSRNTAFRFLDSSYRGTTFMSLEQPNSETQYYLYLNSVGRSRQLAAGEQQNSFIDTDFSNEDLGGIQLDNYTFERIADMQRDGKTMFRVWGNRKDPNAQYPRYLAIVDAETFVAVEMRVFDRSGKVAKIVTFSDIRRVGGKYHIPHQLEVKDMVKNSKSLITIESVKVDIPIRDSVFRPFNMNQAW